MSKQTLEIQFDQFEANFNTNWSTNKQEKHRKALRNLHKNPSVESKVLILTQVLMSNIIKKSFFNIPCQLAGNPSGTGLIIVHFAAEIQNKSTKIVREPMVVFCRPKLKSVQKGSGIAVTFTLFHHTRISPERERFDGCTLDHLYQGRSSPEVLQWSPVQTEFSSVSVINYEDSNFEI